MIRPLAVDIVLDNVGPPRRIAGVPVPGDFIDMLDGKEVPVDHRFGGNVKGGQQTQDFDGTGGGGGGVVIVVNG